MVYVTNEYMRRITCPFKLVNFEEYYQMPENYRHKLESEIIHEKTKMFLLNMHNYQRESRKRNSTIRYAEAV